ncbi:uncharacterized protein LOC117112660 [Anneissia japonica]|uniref:uncharacterized protein LOC117112660 n=1 Tax=Anneissia japonica TaxID=1529436 RepID=UPI0014259C95|nr:uncharacterized protein LOC117112660 [Anneissia japonica]
MKVHIRKGSRQCAVFVALLLIAITNKSKTSAILDKDMVFESMDSIGKNFIMTFMDNHQTHTSDPYLTITAVTEGITTVYVYGKAISSVYTINYGSSVYVDLPNSMVARTADSHDVAVQVTSDKDIHVAGIDSDSTTTDAFQAIPVDALGTEYYVMSFDAPSFEFSEFAITAVQNLTNVTITLSHSVIFETRSYIKGETITRTLEFMETIQIQSFGDSTGTHIVADAPIALQSGSSCAFVPATSSPCDHLVEFIPPVNAYGYEFALAPFLNTQPGYVYRILAAYDNTTILISSQSDPLTLHAGKHKDYVVNTVSPVWMTASKPIIVAQYIKSGKLSTGKGDPAMAIVPAIEQYTGTVSFTTFNGTSSTSFNSYISITAECRYFQNGAFMLSTKSFNQRTDFWRSYPFGNGMCCRIGSVRPGSYTLRHTDPNAKFLVLQYGINTRVSYLLPSQYAVDRLTYKSDDGEVKLRKPIIGEYSLDCQFETNLCGWTLLNGTNTHWMRTCGLLEEGATNVPKNGVGENECDYYAYIRETGSVTSFSKARSPDFVLNNDSACMSFHYFISGPSGSITSYLVSDGVEKMIWTRRDNHGNFWHPVISTIHGITPGKTYYITVEALAGSNFTVAMDGVSFLLAFPCILGDYYAYIRETGSVTSFSKARSPDFVLNNDSACMSFHYFISGPSGSITSYLVSDGVEKMIWTRRDNHGNFWHPVISTIHGITPGKTYYITVEALAGSNFTVAMDGVSVGDGPCGVAPARITTKPVNVTTVWGVTKEFVCEVYGHPKPEIEWLDGNGQKIRNTDKFSIADTVYLGEFVYRSTFTVNGVSSFDNGEYFCQTYNSYRLKIMKDRAAFLLMSFSKVNIIKPPRSATLNVGVNHTFECSASGGPTPTFKWFRSANGVAFTEMSSDNDHIIVEPAEYNVATKSFISRLNIVGVIRADDGKYRCQAKNVVNKQTITKEENCNLYVLTKPDSPNDLVATRITPNSIQVTWDMDFTGNLPLTECILTYVDSSKAGFASQLVHISVENSKFILGGVDALVQYNISLSCSNIKGESEPAYASFVSKMTKSAVVTAVTNNDVSQAGTAQEKIVCLVNAAPAPTVNWFKSPPDTTQGKTKITNSNKYTVSDVKLNGYMMYTSTLTINNIQSSDTVQYYCQATNGGENSEKSTLLTVLDKPGPVTNIRTDSQADNSLVVSWTFGSTGNLPLQTCYVTYIDSNAKTLAPDIRYISAKYSKLRISYLRPSTYYNITVACGNKIGYGPAASQAFARVDGRPIDRYTPSPTTPSTTTFSIKASAISLTSTSLLIIWSTGTYDVRNIKECLVKYKKSNTNNDPVVKQTIDLQLNMFTLATLTPETKYDITITCENTQGIKSTDTMEMVSTMKSDTIEGNDNNLPNTGKRTNNDTDNSSSSVGLAIGLTLVALLLVIVVAVVVLKLRQKRPVKKSVDENGDPLDIFASSN